MASKKHATSKRTRQARAHRVSKLQVSAAYDELSGSGTESEGTPSPPERPRQAPQTSHHTTSGPATSSKSLPTSSELLAQSKITTDAWYKSKRTTKAYANYVKGGKNWLQGFSHSNIQVLNSAIAAEEHDEGRHIYAGAFDTVSEHTPIALRLYITFKCDHQNLGFSTAEGIRSAFKSYFEMYETFLLLRSPTQH